MKARYLLSLILVSFVISIMAFNKPFLTNNDWKVPSKFKKMKNPYLGVEDPDRIGKSLYVVHCKSCHGKTGMGDGTKSKSIDTPMPDFTKKDNPSQTDGELYYKTIFGRDEMPSYEKKIRDEEDRWLLVNYIRKLNK